jgi:hypothetical protein
MRFCGMYFGCYLFPFLISGYSPSCTKQWCTISCEKLRGPSHALMLHLCFVFSIASPSHHVSLHPSRVSKFHVLLWNSYGDIDGLIWGSGQQIAWQVDTWLFFTYMLSVFFMVTPTGMTGSSAVRAVLGHRQEGLVPCVSVTQLHSTVASYPYPYPYTSSSCISETCSEMYWCALIFVQMQRAG